MDAKKVANQLAVKWNWCIGKIAEDDYRYKLFLQLVEALQKAEEFAIKLGAISTASIQNTEKTIRERIDDTNPYYTAAYADVCVAVDREMALRERIKEREETWKRYNEEGRAKIKSLESKLEKAVSALKKIYKFSSSDYDEECTLDNIATWAENALQEITKMEKM